MPGRSAASAKWGADVGGWSVGTAGGRTRGELKEGIVDEEVRRTFNGDSVYVRGLMKMDRECLVVGCW